MAACCDGTQRPQGAHLSRRVARRPDMVPARPDLGSAATLAPARRLAGPIMARGQVTDAAAEEDEDVLFHKMGRCRCATCLWEKPVVPRVDKTKAASPPPAETVQMLALPQYREPRCGYVAPAPIRVTARPKPPPPPPRRWDLFALAFFAAWILIACLSPVGPGPLTWGARRPRGATRQVPEPTAYGTCDYAPVEEAPAPVPYCDEPVYGAAAPGSGAAYQQQAASSYSGAQWDRFDTWDVSQ